MLIGREIVANILHSESIRPYLDAGLDLSWLDDPQDYSSAAVFAAQDEEAYRFILRHWEQHRKIPSLDYFSQSFPRSAYRLPNSSYTASELVSLVQYEVSEFSLGEAASEFRDLLDEKKLDEAGALLEAAAKRWRRNRRGRSTVLVWDDPEADVEALIDREVPKGIRTGIDELDGQFHGFQKHHLVTYLGGAKAGKTTFLLLSALDSWECGERVLFVTVEMDKEEISDRLNCMGAKISPDRLQAGELLAEERTKLRKFRAAMDEFDPNFYLLQPNDKYTISDLEDDIEKYEPTVVYVDGFYFLIDSETGKPGAHWEGHDNLARELRAITMRRDLTIIVTMQVREKQLKKGELDDNAMMGGTGLIMASNMVLGFISDKDTHVRSVICTRSRSKYLTTIRGKWDWDTVTFSIVEDEEDESYANAERY